jgi:hypothetical protein
LRNLLTRVAADGKEASKIYRSKRSDLDVRKPHPTKIKFGVNVAAQVTRNILRPS